MRDACQYLVSYCVAGFRYSLYAMVFIKQYRGVVFLAFDVCKIYHAHIHTYIAYYRRGFTVDVETGLAVAELSFQSVGIAYRHDTDLRLSIDDASSAVTYSLSAFIFLDLYYCGF